MYEEWDGSAKPPQPAIPDGAGRRPGPGAAIWVLGALVGVCLIIVLASVGGQPAGPANATENQVHEELVIVEPSEPSEAADPPPPPLVTPDELFANMDIYQEQRVALAGVAQQCASAPSAALKLLGEVGVDPRDLIGVYSLNSGDGSVIWVLVPSAMHSAPMPGREIMCEGMFYSVVPTGPCVVVEDARTYLGDVGALETDGRAGH